MPDLLNNNQIQIAIILIPFTKKCTKIGRLKLILALILQKVKKSCNYASAGSAFVKHYARLLQ